ncbi:hypothetical protein BKA62DRAFT_800055 [Auriculariales sp. MPI-PUGE-AT-0066]|jgi:hypothetical protein|nr:hypothetical protein BKA62DRAFT_800055 [Auriculariales sp. MPI-PUGE-AT-0066]
MQSNSNPRSALLSGLRTGGVRSASQPSIAPHTAALGGSFNVARHPSFASHQTYYEDEADELADMVNYGMHLNAGNGNHRMMPATAGPLDGGNRFQQQQQVAFLQQMAAQRSMNSMNGMGIPNLSAADPMQQLMQLELMKLQALQQAQQQQYQVELLAQNQLQQQLQQQQQQQQTQRAPSRRASTFGEPATAGPGQTSFDLRGSAQFTREGFGLDQDVPKTAALSGKFGGRPVLSALNPNATVFTMSNGDEPGTPKTATPGNARTTVISGGTSLGGISTTAHVNTIPTPATPSKSDSASSWRRPSAVTNGNSPLTPTRTSGGMFSSPTPRLNSGVDDTMAPSPLRQRPSPLRLNKGSPRADAEGSTSESDLDSYASDMAQLTVSASSASDNERDSSPGTPPSAGSSNSVSREEASKRLYEGLGVGRPVQIHVPPVHVPVKQQAAQVLRQPRGPPASVDELGPRNFAARIQKRLAMSA